MKPINLRPSPSALLLAARGESETYAPLNLAEYEDVIVELRRKNYSFAKIAEWLAERLGRPVNKGGVFRVHADWLARMELIAEEDPSRFEEPNDQEMYEQAVEDFARHLVDHADKYERDSKCSGLAADALERASTIIRERQADERAAEDIDSDSKVPETK